jgi:hypothetical protein
MKKSLPIVTDFQNRNLNSIRVPSKHEIIGKLWFWQIVVLPVNDKGNDACFEMPSNFFSINFITYAFPNFHSNFSPLLAFLLISVIQLKSEIISANVKICTHGKKRN